MAKNTKRIDVHHHITPKEYVEKLKSIGITESLGVPFPDWTPESSLKFMKKIGTGIAVMSVTSPGVCFPDNRDFSIDIARWCNEYMAEVKKKHPGKFGGFASIPLNWIDESIEELKYALGTLGLDGVCLMTNYDGKYLGDEAFDDFFSELNKRKAVLYIHPSDPAEEYDPKLADTGIPNSLIEVTFETTRMAANLLYMDVTDRYPDIKYILSHGGGTIPYLGWRLAMIKYARKNKKPPVLRTLYDFLIKGGPEAGLNDLKQMYYDTALTSGPYALNTLNEFAGSSQIVFGSDFPMAKVAPIVVKNLDNHPEFSAKDIEDINYKNSLELFPQFQI